MRVVMSSEPSFGEVWVLGFGILGLGEGGFFLLIFFFFICRNGIPVRFVVMGYWNLWD